MAAGISAAAAWARLRSTKIAHQPVEGVVEGEGGGGEGQRQAGQRSGGELMARPASSRVAVSALRPAKRHQQPAPERAGGAAGSEGTADGVGSPANSRHHRTQRGAARCAGDVGRGEGVGEHRLQGRAADPEHRAIAQGQQGAGQASSIRIRSARPGSIAAAPRCSGARGSSSRCAAAAPSKAEGSKQPHRAPSSAARPRRSSAARRRSRAGRPPSSRDAFGLASG